MTTTGVIAVFLAALVCSGVIGAGEDGVWVVISIGDDQLAMCHGWDADGNELAWDEVTFVAICKDGRQNLNLPMGTFIFDGFYTGALPKLPLAVGDRFHIVDSLKVKDAVEVGESVIVIHKR